MARHHTASDLLNPTPLSLPSISATHLPVFQKPKSFTSLLFLTQHFPTIRLHQQVLRHSFSSPLQIQKRTISHHLAASTARNGAASDRITQIGRASLHFSLPTPIHPPPTSHHRTNSFPLSFSTHPSLFCRQFCGAATARPRLTINHHYHYPPPTLSASKDYRTC